MKHLARFLYLCATLLFFAPSPLYADQEVTLKSGATLIGKVSIEGDTVVVDVDESKLRVPLKEVATIAAVDVSKERQARLLLLASLEAKMSKAAGTEVIGLLAEAARLAPDDPYIGYWYASSLADAGFGKAADAVLKERHETIAEAYPGMVDQLAKRIKERVRMENMPSELVERIDALNASVAHQAEGAEMRKILAVFRLVDQTERPIDRSAFQIQCNGQDENLEAFDDGFFAYTFNRHRNNDSEPCRLDVAQPGLESKTFEFSGGTNRVQDAGTFTVQRFDEKSKTPFRIRLAGADGRPVAGAQIALQPMSSRGGTSGGALSAESDAEGRAEIIAYPMRYAYSIQADGFNFERGEVELKVDGGPLEKQIQLYAAVLATVRVAWMSNPRQDGAFGGGRTTGEATLQVDGGPPRPQYGPDQTAWIRPLQVKDSLTLQFADAPFGYGPYGPVEPWVRVIEPKTEQEEGQGVEAALLEFESVDLEQIDKLKDELRAPRTVGGNRPGMQRGAIVLPAQMGKVYVGRLQHRDMRTGQPMQLAFKVFVEEMATDKLPAE